MFPSWVSVLRFAFCVVQYASFCVSQDSNGKTKNSGFPRALHRSTSNGKFTGNFRTSNGKLGVDLKAFHFDTGVDFRIWENWITPKNISANWMSSEHFSKSKGSEEVMRFKYALQEPTPYPKLKWSEGAFNSSWNQLAAIRYLLSSANIYQLHCHATMSARNAVDFIFAFIFSFNFAFHSHFNDRRRRSYDFPQNARDDLCRRRGQKKIYWLHEIRCLLHITISTVHRECRNA